MAMLNTNGLDDLMFDLNDLGNIPVDVIDEMLMAGGEVIVEGQKSELRSEGLVGETRNLISSVGIHRKRHSATQHYVLIYPSGTHHTYRARSGTYTKMNWGRSGGTKTKGGGTKAATNNDVGFVHEFGGHGNQARQWMRTANEKNIDKAVNAEYAVYNNYLASKGL